MKVFFSSVVVSDPKLLISLTLNEIIHKKTKSRKQQQQQQQKKKTKSKGKEEHFENAEAEQVVERDRHR